MADTNETIADIRKEAEAKFRELIEAWMQRRSTFQTTLGAMQAFNNVFDRLEAAHKREKAAIEADALAVGGIVEAARKRERGDCAKLREALEIAKKAICNHARANHTCDSLAWENSTINANCGDILCAHRDLCEAKTAVQKALAAPPRNCDRPECATTKAAQDVWRKEDGGKTAYYEWLLANYEKGENNGNK